MPTISVYRHQNLSSTSDFDFDVCFAFSGEKLTEAELDEVVKDCMDEEDEDGMIPYVREYFDFL